MESAEGRVFYRVVDHDPPDRADFLPQGQRPRYRLRPGMSAADRQSAICGVSVFESELTARRTGVWLQSAGKAVSGVSIVVIPDPSLIDCDDSVGGVNHWDLYGTTDDLFGCVTGNLIPL